MTKGNEPVLKILEKSLPNLQMKQIASLICLVNFIILLINENKVKMIWFFIHDITSFFKIVIIRFY